jgi:hypothetical protein
MGDPEALREERQRSALKRWSLRIVKSLGIGAAIFTLVLGWAGIGDWRPFCGLTNSCSID